MDKLLLHADTCDAKLVSSDHREFSVHKAVLALGSNVLKSYFFSQHKEASVYQMDCKSNVVVHIIDFLYKGPNGMPQSWFNRFCDWHPKSKLEAVDDWVDLIVTTHTSAKKLQMAGLMRTILSYQYKLFLSYPEEAMLVVPAMHNKCLTVPHAHELKLLTYCCYELGRNFNDEMRNSLLTYGKNGDSCLPQFNKNSVFQKAPALIDPNNSGIILIVCSPNESMNGFYFPTHENDLETKKIITYTKEDAYFFFEEEWEQQPANGVAGIGTLYATQSAKMEHNKCRRQAFHMCHWNEEVEHPVWVMDANSDASQHPVVFRFCSSAAVNHS